MPDKKESVAKLYVGDGQMRREMGQGEQHRITIVNTESNTAWMLNPNRQEYVEFKVPGRPPLPGEGESLCAKEQGLTCTKVSAEKMNGRNTEKWEIVMSQGDRKLRSMVWVDRSLGVPVREELPGGYVRELRDIQEASQDPSLFQVPGGYERIELPEQPPEGAKPEGAEPGNEPSLGSGRP
nr:DUF4412 domain-containing protein [Gammaproteobacteria bacterium]